MNDAEGRAMKVSIYDCRKHVTRTFGAVRGKPGDIVEIGAQSLFIAAQGGEIEVLRVKAAVNGVSGKKMDATTFAREHGLRAAY
jgi:methionyl-tRNA formyltransferase